LKNSVEPQNLKLDRLHEQLAPLYSHTERPSIDPELMIRILLVGYCSGIRSERRLCEEASLNLAAAPIALPRPRRRSTPSPEAAVRAA
jgi:hypothetical protein